MHAWTSTPKHIRTHACVHTHIHTKGKRRTQLNANFPFLCFMSHLDVNGLPLPQKQSPPLVPSTLWTLSPQLRARLNTYFSGCFLPGISPQTQRKVTKTSMKQAPLFPLLSRQAKGKAPIRPFNWAGSIFAVIYLFYMQVLKPTF